MMEMKSEWEINKKKVSKGNEMWFAQNAVIFNQKLYQNRGSLEMSFDFGFNKLLLPVIWVFS